MSTSLGIESLIKEIVTSDRNRICIVFFNSVNYIQATCDLLLNYGHPLPRPPRYTTPIDKMSTIINSCLLNSQSNDT